MCKVDYCATKFACVGLDEALRVEMLVQVALCWFIEISQTKCSKNRYGKHFLLHTHTNQGESILNRSAG